MKEVLKTEIISTGTFSITLENILFAVLIFIAAWLIAKVVTALITRSFKRKNKFDGRHLSFNQLIRYGIWTLAIIFILQSLGINITFLIASSAALLVGIGLGLQSVFKDFVAGIILLIEGTVKVDDVIEIDSMIAKVKEISLRVSKVTTREEIDVIIPNHRFIENNVINWSHSSLPTRFVIDIGVDYSVDVSKVQTILMDCALKHKDVLNEDVYKPGVRFKNFGGTLQNPQQVCYNISGTFNAKLVVTDDVLADSITKTILVHPSPPVPVIIQNGDTLYICPVDTSYSYQWYRYDTLIAGATDTVFSPALCGRNYNVRVTNSYGCSIAVGINNICGGLENISPFEDFTLFPNPATDQLTVRSSHSDNGFVTFSIINILGEAVFKEKPDPAGSTVIDIRNLKAGFYFLEIKMEKGKVVTRFIKI